MPARNVCLAFYPALLLAALAAAGEPLIAVRPGGLLPFETLSGVAVQIRPPDPLFVPRADGGVTALFFYTFPPETGRPVEIVYANLNTGATRMGHLPEKIGNPWPRMWGPDGRLYMGTWSPATLLRYDPATDEMQSFGVLEPDATTTPKLTVGTDGKVYAMCGPTGHVFSMNPATDEVVRYGIQGPERKYYIAYRGSLGVDDAYIYSTFGNIPSETYTVAMDKRTRAWTLLEGLQGARIVQGRDGVTARHEEKDYWLVQGKAIPKKDKDEPPPWPVREPGPPPRQPKVSREVRLLPGAIDTRPDGTTRIWYRLDRSEAWRSLTFSAHPAPMPFRTLGALPDGRLFATTTYNGIHTFDPATKALAHQGIAPMSNYCATVAGGRVYLGSYPGGSSLFVWDPARPWTINKARPDHPAPAMTEAASNPRKLPVLMDRRQKAPGGFQHVWFVEHAFDHTLYFAIHGERHNIGSVIAWRELDTGASGFLREPFELYDPAGLCLAGNGRTLVFATRAIPGLKGEPKPDAGRVFVIDVATRKVEWSIDPLPGVESAGMVVEGKPGEVILAALRKGEWRHDRKLKREEQETVGETVLYKIDMRKRKVTQRVDVPGYLAGRREYYWMINFVKGPDDMIYTFHEEQLVRIDPADLRITALSKVGEPGRIAFSGRDVYLSGLSHLRRVKNVLPE